jgi:hypothetical protein
MIVALRAALAFMVLSTSVAAAVPEAPSPVRPLGLYAPGDFVVTTGDYSSLAPAPQLYFAKEWIAVPRDGVPASTYATGVDAFDDVRAWAASAAAGALPSPLPPLVWIAAPERFHGVRLAADAASATIEGRERRLAFGPRLPSNLSWVDQSTAAFLGGRDVSLRGSWRGDGRFEARTVWPESFRLDERAAMSPLDAKPDGFEAALRALVRAGEGGAREPWSTRLLWERPGVARAWSGKPVLIVMVNGAQGDDDEAWGGHFAVGTGRIAPDGDLADVLVDNFYSLDVVSEKGILGAPVPLDNYLADLNSGQAWYRPSAILVAVLADEAAAARVQGAFNRVYAQFWRHQLPYRHTTMNCAGISVDTLRALGWALPAHEPGWAVRAIAWLAVPFTLAKERSVSQARSAYEYLTQDRTRLFPAVAFETAGASLLRLAGGEVRNDASEVERRLARDLEALVFVHIPQLPSSRAFGSWPVASPSEYQGKVPRDPADVKRVPAPARPFPANLRDADLLPAPRRPSDLPLAVWALIGIALVVAAVGWLVARWR